MRYLPARCPTPPATCRPAAPHRSRAFSLLEFLIAATLTLAIVVGAGLTLATSERSKAQARARDIAAAAGFSVLEQARAFGCQLPVTPDSDTGDGPDGIDDDRAAATAVRCADQLVDPALNPHPDADDDPFAQQLLGHDQLDIAEQLPGDGQFYRTDDNGRLFETTLTSWWTTADGDSCPPAAANAPQPVLLHRQVELRWEVLAAEQTNRYTSQQALPDRQRFRTPGLGGIRLTVPAGSLVLLNQADATPIARIATPCDGPGGDGQAVVWFPFLPEGTYQLTAETFSGTVEVPPGQLVDPQETGG